MLEYITVGDYQTAVGFLLASTPDRSARYYRDALCTLALAVRRGSLRVCDVAISRTRARTQSSSAQVASAEPLPAPQDAAESVSGSLHIQVAKVIAAHAASVGDTLVGVPLLCSAGASPLAIQMNEALFV